MPRRPKRDDEMTKFDRTLLKKARFVSNHKELGLSEYISEAARKTIETDYEKVIRDLAKKLDQD